MCTCVVHTHIVSVTFFCNFFHLSSITYIQHVITFHKHVRLDWHRTPLHLGNDMQHKMLCRRLRDIFLPVSNTMLLIILIPRRLLCCVYYNMDCISNQSVVVDNADTHLRKHVSIHFYYYYTIICFK